MSPRELKPGDVVQIAPREDSFFDGCFMVVENPKPWGAQGFVAIPEDRGKPPGRAYLRAEWKDMEFVGHATFVPDLPEYHDA